MRTPLLALPLIFAACSVTDTGNPTDDGELGGPGSCEELKHEISLDQVSSLGFSAAEVQSLVEGRHTETLAWLDSEFATTSGDDPTEVEVVVEFTGSAHFVESSPRQNGGAALADGFENCDDRLELGATLSITTADGALDESILTTIRAETPRLGRAIFSIPVDELVGELEVTIQGPDGFEPDGPPKVQFDIEMADVGFAGRVSTGASYWSGDGVGFASGGPIAKWPEESPCEHGFAVPAAQSELFQKAMQTFNGRGPLSISYEPESAAAELEYELSSPITVVCEQLEAGVSGSTHLAFTGNLSLSSSDALLSSELDVHVSVYGDVNGDISDMNASLLAEDDDPTALLDRLGIHQPVDFSGYDLGAVELVAQLFEGELLGSLSVTGAKVPACLTEPQQADPDGMGVPGCEGIIDPVDLWVAEFSE